MFLKQTKEKFLKYPIFKYHRYRAELRSKSMGKLSGSFMQGERNEVGFLGEEVFKSVFPYAVHFDAYGFDFLLGGKKVEVKSQTRNVRPSLDFENVLHRNSKQDFQYLVILSIGEREVTFVGWVESLDRFTFVERGSPRPNGGTYRASGLRIPYRELSRDWSKLWGISIGNSASGAT